MPAAMALAHQALCSGFRRLPGRVRGPLELADRRRRELRWELARATSRSFVAWIEPGVRARLLPRCELSRLVYCKGYEGEERALVRQLLRPGDTFIDVGAHFGLYSLLASSCVGPGGRVIAFEPTPATFERLRENVALNRAGNVECLQQGLSDRTGELELRIADEASSAWNSFGSPARGGTASSAKVSTMTLDRFVGERGIGRVRLIKVDVEGWEARVLTGAAATLGGPEAPDLLVEFSSEAACAAGAELETLWRLLSDHGYRMSRARPGPPSPIRSLGELDVRNVWASRR